MGALITALSVFLIAGGVSPEENHHQHLEHLRGAHQLFLEQGISPDHISIFWADGEASEADRLLPQREEEPLSWLLAGSPQDALTQPPPQLVNTRWVGRKLIPAKRSQIQNQLRRESARLSAGDTLLIIVTDHGLSLPLTSTTTMNSSTRESAVALWGENWRRSELLEDLQLLPDAVQIKLWMSQCYSGGFGQLASHRPKLCGVMSAAADRPSYGCGSPEGQLGRGHFFYLLEALRGAGSLGVASDQTLLNDQSPDTPLRSSDLFLSQTLREHAEAQGIPESHLIDDRKPRAGAPLAESERVLLQRVSQISVRYGLGQVSSFSEAQRLLKRVQDLRHELEVWTGRWEQLYSSAQRRLLREMSRGLDLAPSENTSKRARLRKKLYRRLRYQLRRRRLSPRLRALYERVRDAHQLLSLLMRREAVVARVLTLYRRLSAPYLLPPGDRELWSAITQCEDELIFAPPRDELELGSLAAPVAPLDALLSLPKFIAKVTTLRPGYLAVHYRDLPRFRGVELRDLFHGSPAWAAALQRGDQILSIDGEPLDREGEFPEMIALSEPGELLRLQLRRGRRAFATEVAVVGAPLNPASPRIGELIPPLPLESLSPARESPPVGDGRGTILFFWASWCTRCFEVAPTLARWAFEHDLQVIAISSEDRTLVQSLLAAQPLPFPSALDRRGEIARLFHLSRDDTALPQLIYIDGERRFLLKTGWHTTSLPEPLQLLFERSP
ncbi:MAG: redoxin domain-containing protein [Myxococcota bacterium]|nr:redoxin domain-containing protein [Myxococcota bacterium]